MPNLFLIEIGGLGGGVGFSFVGVGFYFWRKGNNTSLDQVCKCRDFFFC